MCKRCWCWSRILQTQPVLSPCGARLICLPPSAVLTMLSTVHRVDPPPPQHRSPLPPLLQVCGSSLRDYSICTSTGIWMLFKGSEFTDPFLWSIDHSYSHFKRMILMTSLVSTSEICNDHESWENTCISVLIHVYVEILLILSSNNTFCISMYFVDFCQ